MSQRITKVYQDYRRLERIWFETLPLSQLNLLTDRGRVPIGELHLYGEVGFLLLGLKPCVLVEHIPRELGTLDSYIHGVCKPWLSCWFSATSSSQARLISDSSSSESLDKELNLELQTSNLKSVSLGTIHVCGQVISRELQSPEISLQGCWVFYNTAHQLFPKIDSILLNQRCLEITEDTLALLLDYPGSLPRSQTEISTMLRVGYVETSSEYWLTTYAGQSRQLSAIQDHFHTYRQQFLSHYDSELQLFIEDLS
ncbi:hypothetical protein DSO57_1028794 [Entomophthora muscae]|uniref:Uncharacterized protein n=1 Tax=Entomophthora muscae TaxID=34485 RepID=A0ACC2ULG9_9FUNG|nr:hypothetical protein DSO57_1028794 [Entomophthora muscae]